jgi:putative oxidoreductase
MRGFAFLILRLTLGSLLAGHGAQKLFGWFGGRGLEATTQMLDSQGFRPARPWALVAGSGEFGGGLLTALGFLSPLGPLGVMGSMIMAASKFHAGKPIWNTQGGPELPLTNLAIATALGVAGPGRYSLDRTLGTCLPRWLFIPGLAGTLAVVGYGMYLSNQQQEADPQQPAAPAPLGAAKEAPQPSGERQAAAAAPTTPLHPEDAPVLERVDLVDPPAPDLGPQPS